MATDFFERQSTARRNTKWLIWAFTLSVIGILVTTFVVTAAAASHEIDVLIIDSGKPALFRVGTAFAA